MCSINMQMIKMLHNVSGTEVAIMWPHGGKGTIAGRVIFVGMPPSA